MNLVYERKEKELPLTCYVDSDWGNDSSDRKSITGNLVKVSSKRYRIPIVSTHSTWSLQNTYAGRIHCDACHSRYCGGRSLRGA
ncbi:hypothetical protein Trydic_g293 [Trypoxylus dichotomus]